VSLLVAEAEADEVADDDESSLPQPATTNPSAKAAAVIRTIVPVRTGSIVKCPL
jgi:hypothetical protein